MIFCSTYRRYHLMFLVFRAKLFLHLAIVGCGSSKVLCMATGNVVVK